MRKKQGTTPAWVQRKDGFIIHAGIRIEQQHRFYRRLCFDGNTECTFIKFFQRLIGCIECSFRKNKNGYSFAENRYKLLYTLRPLCSTASVYCNNCIPVNKTKH